MQVGFSINEILFLVTVATGLCRLAWTLRLRRAKTAAVPTAKPLWVSFGAELFVVAALMLTCRVAVADWPKVPSGSMEPTLRVGDYLLVNHLAYGPRLPFTNTAIETGRPARGDIVVFRYPPDVSQFYVKRLVGMPGDVVSFRDGAVSIDGQPFDITLDGEGDAPESIAPEDRGQWLVRETASAQVRTLKINPFVQGRLPLNLQQPDLAAHCASERPGAWRCTVPPGHYLMLGDNRDNSADSRVWGFLPHEQVYGKAVRVLFNLHDLEAGVDRAVTAAPLELHGKHVVLGLSGGIACYKAADLVRELVKAGATVQVVMTDAAQAFIAATTLQALSNRPVQTSQWDAREPNAMAHINLTRDADAVLIAPASADFIFKLAHGAADDLLSLLCLARPVERCPLLVAPAMNREMWAHPATQRNVAQLRADGTAVLGPGSGDQACGETGDGRMLEAAELRDELIAFFQPKPLAGRRVLITAGPTFEPIDPVRGITNLSSGKMGFAIARAAREAGAAVTLVAGPVHLPTPRGVVRIDVQTAQQMHDAVLPAAARHDVFVATAAVADWRPAALSAQKIKKNGSKVAPTFELSENADILAAVARLKPPPFCVGFAAESEDLLRHARDKLDRKGVPLIVGNLGPATFGRDDNALLLVDAHGHRELPQADKLTLARQLVAEIAARFDDGLADRAR